MRYWTNVYWNKGREAEKNQDSVALQQVLTSKGRVLLAVVCDGMGGIARGEAASGYAAERLREWFYTELFAMMRKNKRYWVLRRSLDRMVFHMQGQLAQYAGREELSLGTTMTAFLVWERTWLLWHLGDSRAYRLREERMEQLTEDHTQDGGKLTKCLGSFGYFTPQHGMGVLKPGDGILICTDGFRRRVTGEELQAVMNPRALSGEEQIGRRLKEIGETCMKRGETDNLSAVYIKVGK
ncbi:MAG: protein phosphatase 2C domain-containing protein [Lachnospiraceae bacterium]